MKEKGLLKQMLIMVIIVLIAFFSIDKKVDASSFAYNAFDWDLFYQENVDYWTNYCKSNSGNLTEDECLEVTLKGKKKYYTNLYKLLAKYERNGYKLNDNYILAVTFYYLTPDSFSDLPEEYLRDYIDGNAYGLDEDIDTYDINSDFTKEYFKGEVDSLKLLTKHMFAYNAKCTDSEGNVIDTYSLTYTEYLISNWEGITKFFGFKDKYRMDCESSGGNYDAPSGTKEINYDVYWKFLEESEYLDGKVHLTNKYSKVLKATNHKLMKELSDSEKEQYEEDLIEIRKGIVKEIKSLIEDYGEFAETPDSYIFAGSTSNSAWWPIGSDEVTVDNGISFAIGNPYTVSISSYFGPRNHPITGELSQHTGIDISGVIEGVTNIIAVKDGTVVYPTSTDETNCPSSTSMDSCGGGYGNYVVIQHNDGTYSLYAHLYSGSITVIAGDTVKKGQVIGKAGSSGNSTGPHLHFEIRVGSNSSASTVDPLNYISPDNPRPTGSSSSEMLKMLHWFEANCNSPKNGNNYVVHNDGYNIPTVGYGVALKYNIDKFKKFGIDVTNMTFGDKAKNIPADEIPIDIVDAVEVMELESFTKYVNNYLAKSSITLADYQVDCLIMVVYQWGDLGNFATMYNQYGNTEALRQNTKDNEGGRYFAWNPSTGNGRAEAIWKLFNQGIYTYGEGC